MNRSLCHDECHCFAMRQAARYMTQLYDRHLQCAGVTAAQFTILGKLASRSEVRIASLATEMVMDRTTVSRALKPLEREGLIKFELDEDDARVHLLTLTEHGKHVYEQAKMAWRNAHDEVERKFGKERTTALRRELFLLTHDAQPDSNIGESRRASGR
jgi:DNA-binding MarR family transcriptional regulator